MSPHRTFLDDLARLWNAWEVIPAWGDRRAGDRRGQSEEAGTRVVDRRVRERRHTQGLRIALPPKLAHGWVAFEFADERRRVAPIPEGWSDLSDAELRELWRGAEQLPPRRKRLVE